MMNVTVIVSGTEKSLSIATQSRCVRLMEAALEAGGHRDDPSAWEMRNADGYLIEPSVRLVDAGVFDGSVVYLSPRPGVGA